MKKPHALEPHPSSWRARIYQIIFETDTRAGKRFDIVLLWVILLSVIVVMLESVRSVRMAHGPLLRQLEWGVTGLFTVEYILRLLAVKRPHRYAGSFFGITDILAVVPTYLSVFLIGSSSLLVLRALRLLRIFRILKLGRYIGQMDVLVRALKGSRDKIFIFVFVVLTLTVILGTLMYLIEGETHGFSSIPRSIYWAIVTMTTVGYGDIVPSTVPGQMLAAFVMILGYAIIVVPTGIFSVELARAARESETKSPDTCPHCGHPLR